MSKSTEEVSELLKQIETCMKKDDSILDDTKDEYIEIEDITITSSINSSSTAQIPTSESTSIKSSDFQENEFDYLSQDEVDPEVNIFLHNFSQVAERDIETFDDAIKEYEIAKQQNDCTDPNEVTSFIMEYNKHFNVAVTSLNDIIDITEALIGTNTSKSKASKIINKKIDRINDNNDFYQKQCQEQQLQINELQNEISKLESERDQIKFSDYATSEKISHLEHQLESANMQLSSANDQNKRLELTKNNLEKAYSSLESLMESQIKETSVLIDQREALITLLHQQTQLHSQQDQIIESFKQDKSLENNIIKQSNKPKSEINPVIIENDNSYEDLALIVRELSEKLEYSISNDIISIRDANHMTPQQKILQITQYMCNYTNHLEEEIKVLNKSIDKTATTVKRAEEGKNQILRLFEGEIRFIEKLLHSTDLQNVVFYRDSQGSSLILDPASQIELARHCAMCHKLIEDTYSINETDNLDGIVDDPSNIFALLHVDDIGSRVSAILSKFEENEENRELYDMFIAQILMNNVLHNHVLDLQAQVMYNKHENQKLQNEIDSFSEKLAVNEEANKLKRKFMKYEKRMRKAVSQIIPVEQEQDLVAVIQNLQQTMKEDKEKSDQQVIEINKQHKKIMASLEQLKQKLKRRDAKIQNLTEENQQLQNEIQAHITFREECENQVKQEIEKIKAEHLSQLDDKNKQIKIIEEQKAEIQQKQENFEQQHQKEKEQLETNAKNLSNSITQYQSQIESLNKEKERKSNEIKQLEGEIQQSKSNYDQRIKSTNDKMKEVKRKYEDLMQELKQERERNNDLLRTIQETDDKVQKATSELEEAKIGKRTLEIRLKANEEKYQNEKKTLQSQLIAKMTSFQTDFEKKKKEEEDIVSNERIAIMQLLSKHISVRGSGKTLLSCINELVGLIDEANTTRIHYLQIFDDISKTQKLLGIDSTSSVYNTVKKILDDLSIATDKRNEFINISQSMKEANEKLKSDLKAVSSRLNTNCQWEQWAKRMHRLFHEAQCSNFSTEQLRLSLEEAILASVSQRSLLYRVQTLREEKKAFVKFNKAILTERNTPHASWGSILTIYKAVKRLQILAGCVPIQVGSIQPSVSSLKQQEKRSTRKHRSRSSSSSDSIQQHHVHHSHNRSLFSIET